MLIPSKFWEGTDGDAMLRRFILMVIGLLVGTVAFVGAWFLAVDLPHDAKSAMFRYARPARPLHPRS